MYHEDLTRMSHRLRQGDPYAGRIPASHRWRRAEPAKQDQLLLAALLISFGIAAGSILESRYRATSTRQRARPERLAHQDATLSIERPLERVGEGIGINATRSRGRIGNVGRGSAGSP